MTDNRTKLGEKKVRLYKDTGKQLKQVGIITQVMIAEYNPESNTLSINGRLQIDLDLYDAYAID